MAEMLRQAIVGRSSELAILAGQLDAASRGVGSTVLITGEPGIGKSRLLREVRGWCVRGGGVSLVGRAVDTMVAIPFRPLAEALLAAYRTGAVREDPDVSPFRAALSRLVPDGESDRVEPGVVSLLHIAEGFLRVARRLGRRHGRAVVLLDDLHWADAETLEVVEYLADNIGSEPVLLLLSARNTADSDAVRRLITLADRRVAVHLRLSRLSAQQTVDMARECLGDAAVPAQVLQLISSRADGLPFFVEELLAGLQSDGGLVKFGDRWVAQLPERARPPVTFAESITRRFASMPVRSQQVLLDAALLGRRIDPGLLSDLGGLARTDVDDALQAALTLTLLVRDEFGIRFRHALSRDALLIELPPGTRAARARRALEALYGSGSELDDERAEVAADLAEIAGDRSRATALLLDVSRRALRQGALTSAESALRRAQRHAADDAAELKVAEQLVGILALVGRVDEAFPIGESLLTRLTDAGQTVDPDGRRRSDVHVALARAAVVCTDWPLAASHLQAAAEVTAAGADLNRSAQIDTMRAVVALGEGRFDDAERLAPAASELAERAGAADLRCEALLVHGRCARMRNLDAAEQSFERARSIAHAAGLAHREARALTELGFIDAWRNGGSSRLIQARDLAAACGAPETEAVTENALAASAWFRGDTDALQAHASAALALSRRYRLGVMVPSALVMVAGAYALRGDAAAMGAVLAEAAPLIKDEPPSSSPGTPTAWRCARSPTTTLSPHAQSSPQPRPSCVLNQCRWSLR
jgi:tetratricopeptide (TPR) repeat protein